MSNALPVLVGCAHGTRGAAARRSIGQLLLAAAAARPDLEVAAAFVDVQQPSLDRTLGRLADAGRSAVVVPLLLSAGYHVYVDVARSVEQHPHAVAAPALGPSPRLVQALSSALDRLAPTAPGDLVVLGAAGSSDPRAVSDVASVAAELARHRGTDVVPAYLSAASPTISDAVSEAVARGRRVVVANYLLAPGFFADRLVRDARAAGALGVSAPLAAAPEVARLVLDRYESAR